MVHTLLDDLLMKTAMEPKLDVASEKRRKRG
jgi:hypothetical protein